MDIKIKDKRLIGGPLEIFYDLHHALIFEADEEIPSGSWYLACGRSPGLDGEDLLFLSTNFSIDNNKISFMLDSGTTNFKNLSKFGTRAFIEIGDEDLILLQDDVIVQPRIYAGGDSPNEAHGGY